METTPNSKVPDDQRPSWSELCDCVLVRFYAANYSSSFVSGNVRRAYEAGADWTYLSDCPNCESGRKLVSDENLDPPDNPTLKLVAEIYQDRNWHHLTALEVKLVGELEKAGYLEKQSRGFVGGCTHLRDERRSKPPVELPKTSGSGFWVVQRWSRYKLGEAQFTHDVTQDKSFSSESEADAYIIAADSGIDGDISYRYRALPPWQPPSS